jgi:DNA-binding IclR family transcriptional regulator
VLLAFQEPEVQHWIFDAMSKSLDAKTFQRLKARVEKIHLHGYELITDETMRGVTDVGMPVLDRKGTALAALTMPFLEMASNTVSRDAATELLAAAAEELSAAMGGEMRRPALPLISF